MERALRAREQMTRRRSVSNHAGYLQSLGSPHGSLRPSRLGCSHSRRSLRSRLDCERGTLWPVTRVPGDSVSRTLRRSRRNPERAGLRCCLGRAWWMKGRDSRDGEWTNALVSIPLTAFVGTLLTSVCQRGEGFPPLLALESVILTQRDEEQLAW